MAKPAEVNDSTFQAEVIEASTPVLVDFWAAWCGPCRMVAPIVEELAGEYDGKVKVMKLDVDANQNTAQKFGVMSIPTLLLFKDGQAVERIVGYRPKTEMKKSISRHVVA